MNEVKKELAIVFFKLDIGKVTMGPPIGPVLGQYNVDSFSFCKQGGKTCKNTR